MRINNVLFVLCIFSFPLLAQSDLVEKPLVIESSGNLMSLFGEDNLFVFYNKGREIIREKFVYNPYKISFDKKCIDYFATGKADSVILIFRCLGVFNDQYEYRVALNKENNFFSTDNNHFYKISVNDIVNRRKNEKVIKKLKVPYIYSFSKFSSSSVFMYNSWEEQKVELKNKMFKIKKNDSQSDYFDYRLKFFD